MNNKLGLRPVWVATDEGIFRKRYLNLLDRYTAIQSGGTGWHDPYDNRDLQANYRTEMFKPESIKRVAQTAGWVMQNLYATKLMNPNFKVWELRELMEPEVGFPVDPGFLIAGFLLAGFRVEPYPHVHFNVGLGSIKNVEKRYRRNSK